MARESLATAAIIVCMVAAVSTLPALLIAGSLPQPVVNNYYQTTTTTTPITNVTYYINGTDTIVLYKCVACHVEPTATRTFTNFVNMSLAQPVRITWIRAKVNASLGVSGAFSICYVPVLNGTELVNYTSQQAPLDLRSFQAQPPNVNIWQGEAATYAFPTCEGLSAKIGVFCYDGTGNVVPISIAIDLFIFYEQWI
ncbi:MAG: hypothetical protein Q6373_004130 [Candidatus Sigynarchaeota archaeon]